MQYAPWVGGPFMWRLGLRPLDLADWIELGDDYVADLAVKATVRREHPDTVFVALPKRSTPAGRSSTSSSTTSSAPGRSTSSAAVTSSTTP